MQEAHLGQPPREVINMSLASVMGRDTERVITVNVTEIRVNPLNGYDVVTENIEELAALIEKFGQMENGNIYRDESPNDGKKYTLVGGFRRFLAVSLLYEQGRGNGNYSAKLVNKPSTVSQEKMMIIADNAQREKNADIRLWEVAAALEYWDDLTADERRSQLKPNEKKRDWIGRQIGLSGRQVQDYLSKLAERESPTDVIASEVSNNESHGVHEVNISQADIKKDLKKARSYLNKALIHADICNLSDLENQVNEIICSIHTLLEQLE